MPQPFGLNGITTSDKQVLRAACLTQEPVHSIRCFPTSESLDKVAEQLKKQREEQNASADDHELLKERGSGSTFADKEAQTPSEMKSAEHQSQNKGEQGLAIELDTLSDEAMNELVSSMIRQASQEDPDIDFLGLTDEDDTYDGAGSYQSGSLSSESLDDGEAADDVHEEGQDRWDTDEEFQEHSLHDVGER